MSETSRYWKRVGHVAIRGADKKMYDYGSGDNALDFKFNIKQPLAAQRIEADIGILGLSMETIHELACWQPWNVAVAKEREIEVYGGYEDGGEECLFKGYIVEAKPTQPPNMWLNIKADNLSFLEKKIVQTNARTKRKFTEILKDLGQRIDRRVWVSSEVKDKEIVGAYFGGEASKIPHFIESLNDVYAYFDKEGTLRVVPRIPQNYPAERGRYKLDQDSGLLGVASLSWDSLTARMRLDTRIGLNDFVWIDSELYPENATGDYLVNTVEHKGHLRGQEWETVLHAWNYTNESQSVRPNWTGGK